MDEKRHPLQQQADKLYTTKWELTTSKKFIL